MVKGKNTLYYGDNLDILRRYIPDESVVLIYLDPPFNSKATYNVLFSEKNGKASAAQIKAFEDTWHWDEVAEETYLGLVEKGAKKVADLIQALRRFLGSNDMMAYLVMMAIRLVELHRVLKRDGSIYLHCDPTASHYLRTVMDAIFGAEGFINQIAWKRTSAHSDVIQGAKHFGRIQDNLLFYAKGSDQRVWNPTYVPYDLQYIEKTYRYMEPDGRRYQTQPLHAAKPGGDTLYEWKGQFPPPGRYWAFSRKHMEELDRAGRIVYSKTGVPRYKIYLDKSKGALAQDIWTDIGPVHHRPKERLGYPTQKPEALLDRIIKASSNEGDMVLDPFCGCGTTITVAEKLKRKWIGIDITHLAISLMKHRLKDTFGDLECDVIGEPVDLKGAEALKEQDPYQFQWWALGLVGARPAESEKKKGADTGIDGYIYFHDHPEKIETKTVIIQVKSGGVNPAQIRDLKGVVEREKAQIGVFITLNNPTKSMRTEAVSAAYYGSPLGHNYPKIQILTIEELLNGAKIEYPAGTRGIDATFRKAKRHEKEKKQHLLDLKSKNSNDFMTVNMVDD